MKPPSKIILGKFGFYAIGRDGKSYFLTHTKTIKKSLDRLELKITTELAPCIMGTIGTIVDFGIDYDLQVVYGICDWWWGDGAFNTIYNHGYIYYDVKPIMELDYVLEFETIVLSKTPKQFNILKHGLA